LFSGGVMLAAVLLQVLAPPDVEPVALKVVVPPVGSLAMNSSLFQIEKFVQLLAPVKVAVKVTGLVFRAMMP
jgi:hypothetical protein